MMKKSLVFFFLSLFFISCVTNVSSKRFLSSTVAGFAQKSDVFISSINSEQDIKTLGQPSEGLIKDGLTIKFVMDLRQGKPQIYFLNHNYLENGKTPQYVQLHYEFAKHILKYPFDGVTFNNSTYFAKTMAQRQFIVGTLQSLTFEEQKYLSIQFYLQDLIAEDVLGFAFQHLTNALQIDQYQLAFLQTGAQQTFKTIQTAMSQLGIRPLTLDQVTRGLKVMSMNPGTAIGFLRINPKNYEELSEMDIPLFTELPLDLSVVAGTITSAIQDVGSHINLKSKERKTPNVVDRDAVEKWSEFNNKAIQLEVLPHGYNITRLGQDIQDQDTGASRVLAYYANKKKQKKWMKLGLDTKQSSPMPYSLMCPQKTSKCLDLIPTFGGKAAKLGFLNHPKVLGISGESQKKMGYRLTPLGFGIPIQYYFNLVNAPENKDLKNKIDDVIQTEMGTKPPLTAALKIQKLQEIQELFYKAIIPSKDLAQIKQSVENLKNDIQKEYGNIEFKKIKIRSSSNAEDLPDFDGAGLHDSYTANIDKKMSSNDFCTIVAENEGAVTKSKLKPATIECAVRSVFASLWNKRAVEERSYKGIDHRTAGMGIAVVPSYNYLKDIGYAETANGVVLTRILNTTGVYGYTITSQDGENLATNPDPGTIAEISLANFLEPKADVTFSAMRYATPIAGKPQLDTFILPPETFKNLIYLVQQVEMQYCLSKKDYYPGYCTESTYAYWKKKSLDIEFKILGPKKDRILIKQVREFSGN